MPHTLTPETAARFAALTLGHVTGNTRTSRTTRSPARRMPARRPPCIRCSTAASTGIPASTATGCSPGCCAASRGAAGRGDPVPVRPAADAREGRGRVRLSRRADGPGLQAALWLGLGAQARRRARTAARPRWARALAPMAEIFAQRFREFLPLSPYPVRVGTHFNTAFGLRMAADYADGTGDAGLTDLLRATALRWYGADADCPAWGEPSGDDFLSSALIEAEALRRLMPADEFSPWFDRFLPRLAERRPDTLFRPPPSPTAATARSPISTGSTSAAPGACGRSPARCRPTMPGCRCCGRRRRPISTRRCPTSPTTTWASTGWRASRCSPWRRSPTLGGM